MINKRYLVPCFVIVILAIGTPPSFGQSLDIAYNNVGISFGNSREFTGFRFNLKDEGLKEINGVNTTFWVPGKSPSGTINGVSLALLGINAEELNGVNLALIGLAGDYVNGISIGLIGAAATKEMTGIGIGGIWLGGGEFRGLMVGGIGLGGERIEGIAFGGVGLGAEVLRGVGAGLIGVGGEDLKGIFVGGIGVGGEKFTGMGLGLVGVGGETLKGFFAGGVGVGGEEVTGGLVALFGTGGERLKGAAVSLAYNQYVEAKWFSAAGYNRIKYEMIGVQIGVLNWTRRLKGVQIGLINYVGNNPKYLRILPLVNVHL
jgi:hypothetical protein